MRVEDDDPPRARIPADVDTPDRIVYGLTARQLAVLTVAAVLGYGVVKVLTPLLPAPVLIAVLTPLAGVAVVVAVGRRDGVPMDVWVASAIRHTYRPRRLAPAPTVPVEAVPGWAPATTRPVSGVPVLRLPARAITEDGVIDTGGRVVALVACTTVNIGLRTGAEQAALIDAYGRWLNSLTAPVQIVISTQRVDLSAHAQRIATTAQGLSHPALVEVAGDYADFLDDLAVRRDPLWRTVTVAVTAPDTSSGPTEVLRRAEHTATALGALGANTAVLDGPTVTAVLTCAVDPYTPAGTTWPRTTPGAVITTGDT